MEPTVIVISQRPISGPYSGWIQSTSSHSIVYIPFSY